MAKLPAAKVSLYVKNFSVETAKPEVISASVQTLLFDLSQLGFPSAFMLSSFPPHPRLRATSCKGRGCHPDVSQMQEQRTNRITFRTGALATRNCLDSQLSSRPCSLHGSFGRRCNLAAAVTPSATAAAAAAAARVRKPGPQPEIDPRSHTQHIRQSLRQGCTPTQSAEASRVTGRIS